MTEPMRLSEEEVIAAVNRIMTEVFEVEEGLLHREALLIQDLGLDSLDGVDLVIALEKTFHCKIGEEEARSIRSMGHIYDNVMARLGQVREGAV